MWWHFWCQGILFAFLDDIVRDGASYWNGREDDSCDHTGSSSGFRADVNDYIDGSFQFQSGLTGVCIGAILNVRVGGLADHNCSKHGFLSKS